MVFDSRDAVANITSRLDHAVWTRRRWGGCGREQEVADSGDRRLDESYNRDGCIGD